MRSFTGHPDRRSPDGGAARAAPATESLRRPVLGALLAGAAAFGAGFGEAIPAIVFAELLLLPRGFLPFRWLRALPGPLAGALLALSLSWPALEPELLGGTVLSGFGHLGMFLCLWLHQHRRQNFGELRVLVAGAGLLTFLGLVAGESGPLAEAVFLAAGLYAFAAVHALVRLNAAAETERVLDLAGMPGFQRATAEEVDRGTPGALRGAAVSAAARVLLFSAIIAVALPLVAPGREWLLRLFAGDPKEVFPEAGDGPLEFAIPPGVAGPPAFGPRLTRAEFLDRRDRTDGLLLLYRRADGQPDPDVHRLRGECYDVLDSHGRWIRVRASVRARWDPDDGASGDGVHLAARAGDPAYREYRRPLAGGRTLFAAAPVSLIEMPRVEEDGAGTLSVPADLSGGAYRTAQIAAPPGLDDRLADPGPEFLLLPEDLDPVALRELAEDEVDRAGGSAYDQVRAILLALRRRCQHLERDDLPPGAGGAPAPERFDPAGFLFERRYGRDVDFATAFAMLLRAFGIPCRLNAGTTTGEYLPDARFHVVRTEHLRAFVEVPFEGIGWVPFDPTPDPLDELSDADLAEIFGLPEEARSEAGEEALARARGKGIFGRVVDFLEGVVASLWPGGGRTAWTRGVAILVLALGVATIFVIARIAIRTALPGFRGARAEAAGATPGFYERLARVLARHGLTRRRSETPVEFARSAVDRLGDEAADVARLTNAFCAIRYGRKEASAEKVADYDRRVDRLAEELRGRRAAGRRRTPPGAAPLLFLALGLAGGTAAGQEVSGEDLLALGAPTAPARRAAAERILAAGPAAAPVLAALLAAGEADAGADERRILDLVRRLDHPDFTAREAAHAELVRIGPPARPALEEAVERGSPEVSARAGRILAGMREASGVDLEADRPRRARREAVRLLGRIGGPADIPVVYAAALARPELAADAELALAASARRHLPAVAALLDLPPPEGRRLVVRALGRANEPPAVALLLSRLASPDREFAAEVARALVTPAVVEAADEARAALAAGDPAGAVAAARRALSAAPGYAEAGRVLAEALAAAGRPEEALVVLGGLALPPGERDLLAARLLLKMGEAEAALARIQAAEQAAPRRFEILMTGVTARLSVSPRRTAEAAGLLLAAKAWSPSDPAVPFRRGDVLRAAGDRAAAARSYAEAAALDPAYEDRRRGGGGTGR